MRTVESHFAALRRKLNVGTHRELVRLAAGYLARPATPTSRRAPSPWPPPPAYIHRMSQAARAHIRLAELLGVLSFGADLGMGQPMEHVLRQCLISLRLAERMGLDEADQEVVYYTSPLAWVGCHVDAYEQAKWFGDDMALKTDFRHADFGAVTARPLFILRHLGAGLPMAERAKLGVTFPGDGRRVAEAMIENHWLAADGLGERLGLPQRVRDSVEQTFERWDGKGVPKGARGEQILLTSRLVALADVVEVFHRAGGAEAAVAVARQRRGTQFDPQVVDVFTGQATSLLAGLDEASSWRRGHRCRAGRGKAADRPGVRHRAGGDCRLHRREVAVHHRPFPRRGRPRRGSRARPRPG